MALDVGPFRQKERPFEPEGYEDPIVDPTLPKPPPGPTNMVTGGQQITDAGAMLKAATRAPISSLPRISTDAAGSGVNVWRQVRPALPDQRVISPDGQMTTPKVLNPNVTPQRPTDTGARPGFYNGPNAVAAARAAQAERGVMPNGQGPQYPGQGQGGRVPEAGMGGSVLRGYR
jgi:hypothetical protein